MSGPKYSTPQKFGPRTSLSITKKPGLKDMSHTLARNKHQTNAWNLKVCLPSRSGTFDATEGISPIFQLPDQDGTVDHVCQLVLNVGFICHDVSWDFDFLHSSRTPRTPKPPSRKGQYSSAAGAGPASFTSRRRSRKNHQSSAALSTAGWW